MLIVIEGTDGSGKGTQIKLLQARLKKLGYDVEIADFPQYEEYSSVFVQHYLRGDYGGTNDVTPYQASLFYALDRYAAKFNILEWQNKGKIILFNRYVGSNMGHQGAKIQDKEEREKFLDWVSDLEFNILGVPKPDLTIFLHVPAAIGQKLVDKKEAREYTNGKKRDIHEEDLDHLKFAEQTYLYLAEKYPEWKTIKCVEDQKLLSIEDIHEKIIDLVRQHVPEIEDA